MSNQYNVGDFCLLVTISLLEANGGRMSVQEVIDRLESVGWKHSLTTYRQKRKQIYEVLRFHGKRGKTTARVIGDDVILNPEQVDKPVLPVLHQEEGHALLETLFRWQPIVDDERQEFRVTFTKPSFSFEDFVVKRNVFINGVLAGSVVVRVAEQKEEAK